MMEIILLGVADDDQQNVRFWWPGPGDLLVKIQL